MSHKKFLEQIADYYTGPSYIKYLSDLIFIFPNKRSALFLKHYIQERIAGGYALMPRFTTFQRFASFTSRLSEANRFEQLFLLYNIYIKEMAKRNPDAAETTTFDKFMFWGDMILDDFDTIDSSMGDASKLYPNLKAYKEITADYLTDDQKEIIERYWGQTNLTRHIESFWLHVEHGEKKDLYKKFVTLWEVLGPVYNEFTTRLLAEHKATKGMQLRRMAEIIKATGIEELGKKKYVFVGLADLSNAELSIMQRMRDAGAASFFWDNAAPTFYNEDKTDSTNIAVRFISRLVREFPMPEDFTLQPIEKLGNIDIIGVPSSTLQTKIAGKKIKEMKLDEKTAFDTAIVVPDSSQLMSLLLSLPKQEHGFNVTLGLPYSSTTFATLFKAIIAMQRHSRKSQGKSRMFFYQDILEILLHPHLQLIAGAQANLMRQYINENNLFNIEASKLVEIFPDLSFIFTPINDECGDNYTLDVESSSKYLENLIQGIKSALSGKKGFKDSFEMEILDYFENQVKVLKDLVGKYSVIMKETTFLSLFERVMLAKTINLEGTPLKGLQVMGVLETRCLDFDNIIYLSMNERSLPKREYVRTMIPNNLRRGYGLPTIEHTESFYSYYFFRSLGRASNATLLYDTRQPGVARGEISRYLEQLLYLHNDGTITHRTVDLAGTSPQPRSITVYKTDEVKTKLNQYKIEGSRFRISASGLKTYLNCPLEFYLKYVNNIYTDNEPTEYIDSASIGNILHRSLETIYGNFDGKPITEDDIDALIKDEKYIEDIIVSEIAVEFRHDPSTTSIDDLTNEARLLLNHIKPQIILILKVEKEEYCKNGGTLDYLAGELNVDSPQWTIGEHTFNFKMKIDRVDRLNNGNLLFIDYKTGKDKIDIGNSLDDLLKKNDEKLAAFQLITYAMAYDDLHSKAESMDEKPDWFKSIGDYKDIEYKIYPLRILMQTGSIPPITLGGRPIPPFSEIRDEFKPIIENIIDNIFNNSTPFSQCDDPAKCRYCHFKSICGRNVPPIKRNTY